jgi:hypothetical protein
MDIFKLLANLLAMTVMAPRRGGDNNNNGTLSFEQQYAGPVSSLPEETMNTPEMIRYQGYPVEVHETSTADGYVLELHRIPLGRNGTGYLKIGI